MTFLPNFRWEHEYAIFCNHFSFMKGRHNPLILFVDTKSGLLTFCWLLGSNQYWLEKCSALMLHGNTKSCNLIKTKLTLKEQRTTVFEDDLKIAKIWTIVDNSFGDCDDGVDWGVNLWILLTRSWVFWTIMRWFEQSWGDLSNLWILLTRSWGRPRPTPALSFYSWAQRRYSGPLFVGAVSLSRGGEQLRLLGS